MYRRRRFCFAHAWDAFDLAEVILPQRLQFVSSLELDFGWFELFQEYSEGYLAYRRAEWEAVCSMLASLPRLRKLSITLRIRYTPPEGSVGDKILEPLMAVQNVSSLEVKVHWRPQDLDRFSKAPFQLSWLETDGTWHEFGGSVGVSKFL